MKEFKLGSLDATTIKFIMCALMFADHIFQMWEAKGAPLVLNMIGRPTIPVFLFFIIEGWMHTHSKGHYMLRMLLASLLMTVCSGLLMYFLPNPHIELSNNIFASFFIVCWYLYCIDCIKAKKYRAGIPLLFLPILSGVPYLLFGYGISTIIIPNVFTMEGGAWVLCLGIALYLVHILPRISSAWQNVSALIIVGVGILVLIFEPGNIQFMMCFAAPFVMLYNGKRGRGMKYFFYIFYPAHIYLLYIIATLT
jgi:hypothetical protein